MCSGIHTDIDVCPIIKASGEKMRVFSSYLKSNVGYLSVSEINVLDKPNKNKLKLMQCPLVSRGSIDSNPRLPISPGD